jgi:hypothetical protein
MAASDAAGLGQWAPDTAPSPDTAPERALPVKSLVTRAKSITTETGSIQDVAGGGSLFAYEFTPGKGGTLDVLANNNAGSTSSVFGLNILPQYKMTTFAINPNYNRSVAPLDGSYGRDGGLATGDSVYLSGMAGLAAGRYTLLPAHYALLPGGYSVTIGPKSSVDMQASSNTVQPDGSMLMAGRLMTSGSGTGNTRTLAFIVQPGAVVNNKSEFLNAVDDWIEKHVPYHTGLNQYVEIMNDSMNTYLAASSTALNPSPKSPASKN